MNGQYRHWLPVVIAILGGCAAGPDYRRPTVPAPTAFKEAWQQAVPADDLPRGPWWRAYGDDELNRLEDIALRANQTIVAADAAYRAAIATVGGSRAALFPTVGIAASSTRSSTGTTSAQTTIARPGTTTTDRVTATADWEIDLWGRLRRGLEVSRTAAEASAGDLGGVQLSVAATLAQDYVQIRSLDMQRDLLGRTITAYRRSLEITRNRYAAGVAPRTDVTQAEGQLATAESQAADLTSQRAALEHAIATLTGRAPEEFALVAGALPQMPPVPAVLPAKLLQRRPDVAAAERRVASANAAIGVARAAYFPVLSLSATDGYAGSQWAHLFSAPERFWSLGPALAATVFDGGARRAQTATAEANYDRAVADYRQTVLTALEDAEDSLAALRSLVDEVGADTRAAAAARETLRATENQYRAGTVSYLNVVIAESTWQSSERNLIDAQGRQLLAHVSLLKAMGGSPAG